MAQDYIMGGPDTRLVAQITATSMTRTLGFTERLPPAEVMIWWNDIVFMIDALLSSSGVDPRVSFCSLVLLERYAEDTQRPIHKLDTYRLYVASLMVASKIICPRHVVPWTSILKETFVEESVCWLEREFLITIGWDIWMMDVVDEVWNAYDRAVEERRGEPSHGRGELRVKTQSGASSIASTANSDDGSSILYSSPLLLSPLRGQFDGLPGARPRIASSLWEDYMSDRARPEDLETDLEQYMVAPYATVEKPPGSKILRTQLSKVFRVK